MAEKLMPDLPTAAMLEAGDAAMREVAETDALHEARGYRLYVGGRLHALVQAYRAMRAVAPDGVEGKTNG